MSLFKTARELTITHQDNQKHWKFTQYPGATTIEVAELVEVYWLDIKANVDVKNLHKKTSYAAFLVFKLDDTKNLERATASVTFAKEKSDQGADEGYLVFLDKVRRSPKQNGRFPECRGDGWMEIKLGEFFNNLGDDGEVEIRLREINTENLKYGLAVRGFDVRPIFHCGCQDSNEPVFMDCHPYVWHQA
ncbi:hypothetical protein Pfo_016297 [Paulownia fortunei]|nr:hypothetical protein Pfo_016297 [Paulownia fortunei]